MYALACIHWNACIGVDALGCMHWDVCIGMNELKCMYWHVCIVKYALELGALGWMHWRGGFENYARSLILLITASCLHQVHKDGAL